MHLLTEEGDQVDGLGNRTTFGGTAIMKESAIAATQVDGGSLSRRALVVL